MTRRAFIQMALGAVGVVAWGLSAGPVTGAVPAGGAALPGVRGVAVSAGAAVSQAIGPDNVNLTLRVNGVEHTVAIDPRVTLLDALRDRLGLTGTRT